MRALFACVVLFVLAGCPGPAFDHPYTREPDPRNKEIVLGPGDVVGINVWENKDLNAEVTIRPDGFITMPLVGDIKANGETPTSLKNIIKTRLQDFIKLQGTEITVAVKNWKSYRFTMQGEVVRQGVFPSDQFVTVGEAIAMAGGLTRFARRDRIVIFRTDPKTRQVRQIPIDYESLLTGRRPEMNIWIMPGDIVSVP